MNAHKIQELIPHRPPVLMLDRVDNLEPGNKGMGYRSFRADDECFGGHFPGKPVLPGVLIVEAIAQTALVILRSEEIHQADKCRESGTGVLAKIDVARFLIQIVPLDTVSFDVVIKRRVGKFCLVSGNVVRQSDQALCATCDLTLALTDG